jgi:hypothetical protein
METFLVKNTCSAWTALWAVRAKPELEQEKK